MRMCSSHPARLQSNLELLLYDLTLLVGGKEKVEQMALNMKKVMFAGEELMGIHQEGRLRMWPVIRYIEKETAYERGGGKGKKGQASRRTLKTMPIIEVKQDVSEDQIEKELKTEEGSAPHLIAFVSSQEDSLQGMYIVGDTIKISVPIEGGIMCGVLKLFASYYVFDLQYPRQHAMVMAILQTFLTDEPYRGATNQKYKFFVEKFRKAFKKLPDPEPMSKD